ncbi:unnamed protein product [Alternaria alternata]
MSQLSDDRLDTPYRMPSASQSLSATRVLAPVDQTRNGQIFMVDPTSSADAMPSLLDAKTYPLESQNTLAAVAQLPPPSVVARSREWSPSVRPVHPEPRDEAPRGRSAEAPTLSNESRNTISAGQTFYGISTSMLTEGLAPHTKPRHSYEKNKPRPQYKRRKSARSFAEDLRHEARFQRARLITAILASCTSSGKGWVICKRKASSRRAAATASVSIPRNRTGGNVTGARTKRIDSRETTNKRDIGVLGPLAGHTLRICFCQPFDGAGKSTHTAATENTCIGKSDHTRNMQSRSKKESPRTDTKEVEVDAVLPIARVVSGTERKMGNNVRQRTAVRKGKTQSTTGTNQHSRMRSDSAVSVGVALRTATAGG